MGSDPRFIPVSERGDWNLNLIVLKGGSYTGFFLSRMLDHAALMDERDAGRIELIKRLHSSLSEAFTLLEGCAEHHRDDLYLEDDVFSRLRVVMLEARGIEAPNE